MIASMDYDATHPCVATHVFMTFPSSFSIEKHVCETCVATVRPTDATHQPVAARPALQIMACLLRACAMVVPVGSRA